MIFGFFKKKKIESSEPSYQKTECSHKYQDFDWYSEVEYDSRSHIATICIFEPYVCIHCKKRKNVLLKQMEISGTINHIYDVLEAIVKKYPHLKDKAIVEDEINDMQLVDREYLEIYRSLQNPTCPINLPK